ncbi:MAG: translocation/assembly module TamB domain-containing protein [Nevskia sp.]|nr:translocation/assembly module TamB domain-containing protein [Nevskia sp.]
MRRRLGLVIAVVAAALLLAGAALWLALDSAAGLRALAGLARELGGGSVRIGAVQGTLLREFVVDDVHYAGADGTRVDLAHLHLRLRPHELLQRRLHVEVAEVEELQLHLPPAAKDSGPAGPVRLPAKLPLDIAIDALSLRGFSFSQGAAPPFRLERAGLAGSWIGDRLEIARLDADLAETGPLQLNGQARMAADHVDVAALELKGPGQIDASGRLGFDAAGSRLQLHWRELRWPLLGRAGDRLLERANGTATLSGPFDRYRFDLHTDAQLRQLPLDLTASGDGDFQQINLSALKLASGKGSAQLRGSVAWAPELRADLAGSFAQLDPALFASGWNGSLNGGFDTRTVLRNGAPDIVFDLHLDPSQLRGLPLQMKAQGDTDTRGVHLAQLTLQSGQGSMAASGSVGWSPTLSVDLKAQIASFDPAPFVPLFTSTAAKQPTVAWSGSINGSVETRTIQRDGKPAIAVAVNLDRSQFRGSPLSLSTNAELRGDTVLLQKLALSLGNNRLDASGQATPPFDLAGKLDASNLAAFAPQLGGHALLDFKLQGPLDDPHLQAHGHAEGLRYQAYRVAAVELDTDLDPARPSHLGLQVHEAQVGFAIHSLKLTADGQETYHRAALDLRSERGDLELAVDGGYDRRRREWGGQIKSGRVAPAQLPPWALEKPAGLLLGATRQSLEPACFSGDGGRACLRLEQNVTRAGLRLSLDLDRLLLATFKPLLPPKYAIDGEIDGSGSIDLAGADVAAVSADLRTTVVHFQAPGAPVVELEPSTLKADEQQGRIHAALDLRFANGSIGGDVSAGPAADFDARPLSGALHVSVPDLAFVESLVPQLHAVGGSLAGQLDLGGTVALPRLQGDIALQDGHAKVVQAGIEVQKLEVHITGRGQGPLALDGSMVSGGGALRVDGTLDPSVAPPRADLALKGENFQAVAVPDARIWVTPDLHLQSDDSGIRLQGTLTVPKADITPQGLGDSGVTISSDQVIVGAEPQPQPPPLRIYSTVALVLGDAVNFKGFGLATRLEGSVTVSEEPQRDTSGLGELRLVEGRYQAYGQDLKIETGRLIFDGGPIQQPAVDLYATRRPQQDITVGVRVRGTLDKPLLTLQSDPAMAREQQLSWLVLGRPLDQSSSGDRSAISQAALSLGLSGGDYFAQKFGKSLGLDQISIGQGPVGGASVAADATSIQGSQAAQNAPGSAAYTSQAAQLTLGKYLTPRLFVSYGVSLFQPGQTFRMLYDIGHGFKLQTESGVASGGDLIYTFERGR